VNPLRGFTAAQPHRSMKEKMNSDEQQALDRKWTSSRPITWTTCQLAVVFALLRFFQDMGRIGDGNNFDPNPYISAIAIVIGIKIGTRILTALKRK